ncbi:acyltransferase family protein [Enterovirga aerilata]|uniref:Acyltransferase n=1 Tax=Enterovirga aerilata TaxID=2730920 RepID=A0A849I7K5_9HYPH|nr:acyltransferase [Enterovirga sp. DB1703]NNM73368.1 acyltransferase [Enterovirga sp. DB1703]
MKGRGGGTRTIAAALDAPANAFTALRLGLALAVVVSHGFSVVTGRVEDEPLHRLTGFTLGEHAVNGFFAVSGFLVTMSFCRRGWRDYVIARALRIAPGLVAATLVVALVLGTALTRLSAGEYLASAGTWRFVSATLTTLKSNAVLPGLFAENPFRMPMGTVWTLKYEVLCYLGVLLAGLAGLFRFRWVAAAVAGGLFLAVAALDWLSPEASKGVQTALRLPFLFAAGGALFVWRDRVPVSGPLALALALAAALAAGSPAYGALLFAAEAYGVIYLGLAPALARPSFDLSQDLSYGVYLYGWPVQQALRQLWPKAGIPELLAPSLLIALAAGWLSWRLVEAPALALKARAFGRRTIRTIEPAAP